MSVLQEIAVDFAAEDAAARGQTGEFSDGAYPNRTNGLIYWFNGLSIGRKIQAFYGINLAFALVAGLFVVAGYLHLGDRAEQITTEHEHAILSEQLVTSIGEARRHSEALVAGQGDDRSAQATAMLDGAKAKVAKLQEVVVDSNIESQTKLQRMQDGLSDFQNAIRAFSAAEIGTRQSANAASDLDKAIAVTTKTSRELASQLNSEAMATSGAGSSLISTLLTVWVVSMGILTVLTLIALRYFDRNVGGTLREMTAEMKKLSAGESDVTISGKDRRDEIGDMARAMGIFMRAGQRLERMSRERADQARAELDEQAKLQLQEEEARRDRERALHDVADQLERTVGEVVSGVAEASTQLQSTSKMMAETAEASNNRVAEVSGSMDEANAGATAAAAASDEFALSIGEISRQAASSAQLARKATTTANEADATISALSDSAQQVGQIVELIQTIAQRTNLLALNASIEAARGGEAGRGFAVVASEVKELAMQTSRATEQVAEQIREMQDTTGASVSALKSIADQVQELETTAVSIASAVDQQSVAGQDLARSIDLAARGTEQVSSHIEEVRELSLSTGSAASQVLSNATNLEDQSAILRKQVNEFLLKVRRS